MTLCRKCGMVNGGIETITDDIETYDICAKCGSDAVRHVDEDAYQDRLKKMPSGGEFYDDEF